MELVQLALESQPRTEAWFGWALVFLLLLFVLLINSAPNFLTERYHAIFATEDRRAFTTASAQVNGNTMVYATLFSVLTWSLSCYSISYGPEPFSAGRYAFFLLLFILLLVLKAWTLRLLCYTFGSKSSYEDMLPVYASVLLTTSIPMSLGLVLYAIFLPGFWGGLLCFFPTLFYLFYAIFFNFHEHLVSNWLSYFYLVLYLLVIELTPLLIILNIRWEQFIWW